jgi:hypothetical protein
MAIKNKNNIIKIGFDFDGVLYYNPIKAVRPFIYFVKKYVFKINKTKFYIPKNNRLKYIVAFLHRSSIMPNFGFNAFLQLLNNPKYEVYIITARLSFIKNDIKCLLKNYDLKNVKEIIQNTTDIQPHIYKEKVIKKLKLDYYIEDNWDIVKHLIENTNTKIIWMSNIVDRFFIKYDSQANNLSQAINHILNKKIRKFRAQ